MLLKDICSLITKGTTPSTIGYKFQKEGINFLKVESIDSNGCLISNKVEHISQDCHNKMKRSQLLENDVLITIAGALGRTIVVNNNFLPANINQAIAILRPNLDIINPRYLHYYLSTDKMSKIINGYNAQSAQPNINLTQLGELEIDIKTKEKQNHIVNIIGSIDDLIEHYNSSINKLWDLITLKYNKSFPNIHNLKGLNVRTLNDVCNRFATGLNPRNNFKLGCGNNYYVTIKNFETGNLFLNDKCDKVDDDALLKINNRSDLQKGDILFSGIGTIGRTYLIPETPVNWNISESVFSIRPSKEISSEFLYLLLIDQDMQSYSHDNASGSVQKGIRMADIKAYKFNLPNKEEIFEFTNNVLNLFDKIENFKKQINYLINLKENYLKKFFG